MYVAELNNKITDQGFAVVNYIDDFQIAINGPINQIQDLKDKTSKALNTIETTSQDLELTFNTEKSNFIIVASKKHHKSTDKISLKQIHKISRTHHQKYLGIYFDEQLTFEQTLKSCYATLFTIKQLKQKLSIKNKQIIASYLANSTMEMW